MSPNDEPGATGFSPEEIAAIVYEARAAGKTVMAHAQATQGIKNAVLGGIHSIEHGIFLDEEVVAEMRQRGTYLVATLVAPLWVEPPRRARTWLGPAVRGAQGAARSSTPTRPASGWRSSAACASRWAPTLASASTAATPRSWRSWSPPACRPWLAIVATTRVAAECIGLGGPDRYAGARQAGRPDRGRRRSAGRHRGPPARRAVARRDARRPAGKGRAEHSFDVD